jgi:xylulose-5-phosphate/fructose-6-phosphate phosphoketolase
VNEIDRFSLAIDAIDRVARLRVRGAHAKERLRGRQIDCLRHAHELGVILRRSGTGNGPTASDPPEPGAGRTRVR